MVNELWKLRATHHEWLEDAGLGIRPWIDMCSGQAHILDVLQEPRESKRFSHIMAVADVQDESGNSERQPIDVRERVPSLLKCELSRGTQ